MNILIIFFKIWFYLGFFYLSLIASIIYYYKKKQTKIILFLFLVINSLFSFNVLLKNVRNAKEDLKSFFLPSKEKLNLISSNQAIFLNEIKFLLPKDKIICYPWSTDIAGRYARQFFYPKKIILGENNLKNCDYLVLDYTVGVKEYELEFQLDNNDRQLFSSKLGKVYKIIKQK